MKKNETQLIERAKYIQKRVNEAVRSECEIKKIASELFISEATIRRDLQRMV